MLASRRTRARPHLARLGNGHEGHDRESDRAVAQADLRRERLARFHRIDRLDLRKAASAGRNPGLRAGTSVETSTAVVVASGPVALASYTARRPSHDLSAGW